MVNAWVSRQGKVKWERIPNPMFLISQGLNDSIVIKSVTLRKIVSGKKEMMILFRLWLPLTVEPCFIGDMVLASTSNFDDDN